jgi:heme oxygenase
MITTTSNLQARLKTETQELHSAAENHPIMQSFVKGEYSPTDLIKFLVNILPLYQVVEQRVLTLDIIDTPELKRSTQIQKDIDKLIEDGVGINFTLSDVTRKRIAYCWDKNTALLKADLYVRWLADFYGGRVLSKSLAPYNNAYESNDPARVISSVRSIMERDTYNVNPSDDEIIDEAKDVFQFHIDLFDSF